MKDSILFGQQEILERLSNWIGVYRSLVQSLGDLITPAIFDLLDTYLIYSYGEGLIILSSCRNMDRLQFYI